jgi:hypothetical protein
MYAFPAAALRGNKPALYLNEEVKATPPNTGQMPRNVFQQPALLGDQGINLCLLSPFAARIISLKGFQP